MSDRIKGFGFYTRDVPGGTGKDANTDIRVVIEKLNGSRKFVDQKGRGSFNDRGELVFACPLLISPITKADMAGTRLVVGIQPDGHDQWHLTCRLAVYFDDDSVDNIDLGERKLGNHGGWPDYFSVDLAI